MSGKAKDRQPLALSDTLRDLALLRASSKDLLASGLVETGDGKHEDEEVMQSLAQSYEFVAEARKALKLHNRDETAAIGRKVEDVRSRLEDAEKGLAQ
ncbi:uncharacterized protein SCHCODRAFT_02635456 [Schizophyllum commune H4-8]|nr:uncharacterized protein SCHCODRAFT_02635456 [Schizophyllum commune H4-8]KAI5889729.1 hypothetical protein SCHCODRAFT_02635456 [Schizophyllum commune H4-8]